MISLVISDFTRDFWFARDFRFQAWFHDFTHDFCLCWRFLKLYYFSQWFRDSTGDFTWLVRFQATINNLNVVSIHSRRSGAFTSIISGVQCYYCSMVFIALLVIPWWAEPQRHTVVVVCLWVILRDSCSHFLCDHWKLRLKTCNASLTQYYLEMRLVDFGLVALLSIHGMICSPRWLLPAIQSPAKNKSLTPGCLSTWQFNLYNKSDGDQSEIRRTRLPKLHSLSFAYLSITRTMCNWRRSLIWHPPV